MKVKYLFLILIAFVISFSYACKDTNDDTTDDSNKNTSDNKSVNDWIYSEMDTFYLWRDKMPEKTSANFKLAPYDFFGSLLINPESTSGYTFSHIESTHGNIPKAYSKVLSSKDLGFQYISMWLDEQQTQIAFVVIYTKPGTDASKKLQRGDVIMAVGGQSINESNYRNILFNEQNVYKLSVVENVNFVPKEVEINLATNYDENPIYLDSIYTVGSRKIGYIMYNSFEAGNEANLPYDVQLAVKLLKFKQAGVKDLIIDLRYNGGGLTRSAYYIASALVSNRKEGNIFEVRTYNTKFQGILDSPSAINVRDSYIHAYFQDYIQSGTTGLPLVQIPRLGDQLNTICIIGTEYTASASELLINGLRPYMNEAGKRFVVLGEKTLGKNVGSWPIYKEDDSKNTYVLWPIIFKSHNKNLESNYSGGIIPDVQVSEFSNLSVNGLKPLGDTQETLLNAAISTITGNQIQSTKAQNGTYNIIRNGSSLDKKSNAYTMYLETQGLSNNFKGN